MSESVGEVIERLEGLAAFTGAWRPMQEALPRLRERLDELKRRQDRLEELLVVALVGGSGVGKSTLLNAIAGDELAETSEFRPCTSEPTVYHPPGAEPGLPGWRRVAGSALEHLIIVDTPDSDTVVREHREVVIEALARCDLIVICGSPEKYLDEATWSLLRPLQGERTMVCVETKAAARVPSVREHWLQQLDAHGFEPDAYFRVSARRTLDRKISGAAPGADEFDWPRLEAFLAQELTRERILRIKRSNAAGLLMKTVSGLAEAVGPYAQQLEALEARCEQARKDLASSTYRTVAARLFAEPHLWVYALGRETSLRAKGVTGAVFRLVEAVRTLPVRVASWLPWVGGKSRDGHEAAALLADSTQFDGEFSAVLNALRREYEALHVELALAMTQAGLTPPSPDEGYGQFASGLRNCIARVLRGPARDRLVAWARRLTGWPMALVADAPPLAFAGFSAWRLVRTYFSASALLPVAWFFHAGAVLGVILTVELLLMAVAVRAGAWAARRGALRDLQMAMSVDGAAFELERAAAANALSLSREISGIHEELRAVSAPARDLRPKPVPAAAS